jgi:hypothetical protein
VVEKSFADMKYALRPLDRLDALIAALCGIGAFAAYARTMSPDILYGDSAELQTLTYTLGHTHSTGYPIYLLLARLVGFIPLNSPAWRVTLFSVLMASLAVAGVYLLSRMLTSSRAGACIAAIGLALSYTMWSQAIITEVYAPGAAFLAWILLLVLHWLQDPEPRGRSLFAAALLAGLSLGVHATTALAVLPAAGLVLLWLIIRRANRAAWGSVLRAGAGGAMIGVLVWFLAFLYIDWHNPPSSFINTTLFPSRAIWHLTPEDMDTPLERIVLTLNSVQWKDVLFAGGADAARDSLVVYLSDICGREFSVWFLLLGLYGWWVLLPRARWAGGFLLASYGCVLFYVLNYHPGDQFVFFLSTYVAFTAVAGVGIGALIEGAAAWKFVAKRGWGWAAGAVVVLILLVFVIWPTVAQRIPAIQSGVAKFVGDGYQFPVENLREPRLLAQMYLSRFPDDAVVLMEWRDLQAVSYLAYVEGKKPGLTLLEAMPRGNDGKVSASLVETIHQALAAGRPVYAAQRFPGLGENFLLRAAANRYVQVLEKK